MRAVGWLALMLVLGACGGDDATPQAAPVTVIDEPVPTAQPPLGTPMATVDVSGVLPDDVLRDASDTGLSREPLERVFGGPSYGFAFEERDPVDGQPAVVASSPSGGTTLWLLGPADALTAVVMTIYIPQEDASRDDVTASVEHMFQLLDLIAPSWAGSRQWFGTSLARAVEAEPVVERRGERVITLDGDKAAGTITLRVTADG